jgi:hypothetical protein
VPAHREQLTLRTQGDADRVREDVDAPQDSSTALVRELDLLVRTTRQRRGSAGGLERGGAESAGRGVGDGVHYEAGAVGGNIRCKGCRELLKD